MGRSWSFPSDAEKPTDLRSKASQIEQMDCFRFPLFYYNNYSAEEVETNFSDEEHMLYDAEELFMNELYSESYSKLIVLRSKAKQISVKVGTLFFICRISILLKKTRDFLDAYEEFNSIFNEEIPHKQELLLIKRDLDTYIVGSDYYIDQFPTDQVYKYHTSTKNYLFLVSAYSSILIENKQKGVLSDTTVYELVCSVFEEEKNYHSAMLMHIYLAIMHMTLNRPDSCYEHIRKGVKLGIRIHHLAEIIYLYHYIPSAFDKVLEESELAEAQTIPYSCKQFYELLANQWSFFSKENILFQFTYTDMTYLFLANQGFTNQQVADYLHRSVSTVSKHYSRLYQQTGTTNKKALVNLCLGLI